MTVPNREYVARQVDALETVLRIAQRAKTDSKLLKPVTGILGCLFKESEEVGHNASYIQTHQLQISFCLHFNSHFPCEPRSAGSRMSLFRILLELRMMEVVVTTGAIRRAKLQSDCNHQQTNTQFLGYRPDALPVAQPTVSDH